MFKEIFGQKKKEKNNEISEMIKLIDSQLSMISMEIEKMKNLASKIENIEKKMSILEELIKEQGVEIKPRSVSEKTKETIKTLLKKYGSLNAWQLGKLLNMSRTRCAEYLKQMEEEGILVSEWKSRKKYYSLRQ
ncbi:MAG: winged helix-turn-helix domain-containing protein [Candidatus Aenigmarchaeota archaeon]|nr:winged helix-turn-helix domain-containing protein [Candidatus Aenigmarchaeota archaeon]